MTAWAAIVLAAGRGTRFGKPKQLVEIAGTPMLLWSVRLFESMPEISQVVIVTEPAWLAEIASLTSSTVVHGGPTRQASGFAGLAHIRAGIDRVLIHDGARPLITREDVQRGMAPVRPGHASLLGIPVIDTIKAVDGCGQVRRTLDREGLWAAQTPQFATLEDMRRAHAAGMHDGTDATDDAMLLEQAGVSVHMVHGSPENFKVTLPDDRNRAEELLLRRYAQQPGR